MELAARVERAAEAALADQQYASMIDVLLRLGWLPAPRINEWRQGRADSLEGTMQVGHGKVVQAMEVFRQWAREGGLVLSGPIARTGSLWTSQRRAVSGWCSGRAGPRNSSSSSR